MTLAHGRLAIGMVTTDCADPSGLAAFWAAALGTAVSGDYGEFVMLAPPPAGGPVLGFQRVPEERAGKNRLHLDLGAATGERHAEVELRHHHRRIWCPVPVMPTVQLPPSAIYRQFRCHYAASAECNLRRTALVYRPVTDQPDISVQQLLMCCNDLLEVR